LDVGEKNILAKGSPVVDEGGGGGGGDGQRI